MSYSLHHVPAVDSTNAYARTYWQHLSDRACVYADVQYAGRGRYGRTWLAVGDGAITMTYVLKRNVKSGLRLMVRHDLQDVLQNVANKELPFHTWAALTQYAALTLCCVLKTYGIDARIKWPNDVLVDGKKIAGILSEGVLSEAIASEAIASEAIASEAIASEVIAPEAIMAASFHAKNAIAENADVQATTASDCAEGFLGIVLGIGINVSLNAENVAAIRALAGYEVTSVMQCLEQGLEQGIVHNVDRDSLLRAYNEAFFAGYDAFMQAGFASIHEAYTNASDSLHKIVQINTPSRRLTGMAKGFTVQGELILIAPPNSLEAEHPDHADQMKWAGTELVETEQIFNSGELL